MDITQHVGETVNLASYIMFVWQHDKMFLQTVLGKLVGKTKNYYQHTQRGPA